ncbi:MAG: ABC transporter permease [Ignavibacteriaceae bacterium]
MFKNYIKIALRNIRKQKAYSFINIMGLSIGMACCILILLFILDEFSYDKFHTKHDSIYRLTREWFNDDGESNLHLARVAPPVAPLLKNDFPEIVREAVRVAQDYQTFLKMNNNVFVEERFYWADEAFFKIFSHKFLSGDPNTALAEPNSIVLTSSMAKKYFGNENALGKFINYERERDLKVTGIIEDVPFNTHFKFDFLGSFNTLYDMNGAEFYRTNWGNNSYLTYILVPPNFPIQELQRQIPEFLDKHISQVFFEQNDRAPKQKPSSYTKLHFQKLTDIHLTSHLVTEAEENGDISNIYLFGAIAFFILLIACINFMNLSTARSAKRAREIGMRKVLGAYKQQLIKQFLGEAVLFAVIALLVSLVLVEVTLPFFNEFVSKNLDTDYLNNLEILLALFIITLFVGIASGSYPAFLLSSFRPVSVLNGKESTSHKSVFRTVLVVAQFTISIALLISMGIVYNQMEFLKSKKLGYNKEHVVILPSSRQINENIESFKGQLLQNKNVLSVSKSVLIPTNPLLNSWGGKILEGKNASSLSFRLAVIETDHDYLDTYGIQLAAGRNFSREYVTDDSAAFILNETAVKEIGWTIDEAVGKAMQYGDRTGRVIGVVKDFNFESLHNKIAPIIILIADRASQVSVKIAGNDMQSTLDFLKEKWAQYRAEYPFDFSFLDKDYEALYKSEKQLGEIFGIFSVLAVAIACLGLFGLASFSAEQRTKEIGVRKVLGASTKGIVLLFSRDFLKLILIANFIAWPLAYFAMNKWLEDFAYKTGINISTFIISGLLAVAIALVTVSYQAIKAALANPVKSLKYE